MPSLEGRTAIVTGAAGGMGGGITRRFVREGATVVCVDREDCGERLAELERIRAGAAEAVRLDVRDLAALEQLVDDVAARHGTLDVMVNNAGIEQPLMHVVDTPEAVFREVIDVNLWGVFAGCRAAGRVMRAQRSGAVINTASQLGKVAFAEWGVWGAESPGFVGKFFGFLKSHPRVRMAIYYQSATLKSEFRLSTHPQSRAALRRATNWSRLTGLAPEFGG